MNGSADTNPDDYWSWTLLQTKHTHLTQDFFHSTGDCCLHSAHTVPGTQTQRSALLAHPTTALQSHQLHCWSSLGVPGIWGLGRGKYDLLPCTSFPSLPCVFSTLLLDVIFLVPVCPCWTPRFQPVALSSGAGRHSCSKVLCPHQHHNSLG